MPGGISAAGHMLWHLGMQTCGKQHNRENLQHHKLLHWRPHGCVTNQLRNALGITFERT